MIKPKFLNYFLKVLEEVANNSECRSRKTGAILIKENTIILEGWNSPPAKSNISECEKCNSGSTNLGLAICAHAEINLLASAAKFGISTEGCDLLTYTKPCLYCSGAIIRAGISAVYYLEDYWTNSEKLFLNAGIPLIKISKEENNEFKLF